MQRFKCKVSLTRLEDFYKFNGDEESEDVLKKDSEDEINTGRPIESVRQPVHSKGEATSSERKFSCETCHKSFKRRHHLSLHV